MRKGGVCFPAYSAAKRGGKGGNSLHAAQVANVKSHSWFEDLNWDQLEILVQQDSDSTSRDFSEGSPGHLRRLECPPPYKPAVRNVKDLSNFVAKKEDAPKTLEYLDSNQNILGRCQQFWATPQMIFLQAQAGAIRQCPQVLPMPLQVHRSWNWMGQGFCDILLRWLLVSIW